MKRHGQFVSANFQTSKFLFYFLCFQNIPLSGCLVRKGKDKIEKGREHKGNLDHLLCQTPYTLFVYGSQILSPKSLDIYTRCKQGMDIRGKLLPIVTCIVSCFKMKMSVIKVPVQKNVGVSTFSLIMFVENLFLG